MAASQSGVLMSFTREYFPSDTLKLINESEGKMVRAGVQRAPADPAEAAKSAHSIGRHLLRGSPGAGAGQGVGHDTFKSRFEATPFYDDGSLRKNSGWKGKGDMAIALCDLLNSNLGQAALAALDGGAERVVINHVNVGAVHKMTGKEPAMVTAMLTTYAAPIFVLNHPEAIARRGLPRVKEILPRMGVTSYMRDRDIVAVTAVLDRHGTSLHLQTLYPNDEFHGAGSASWKIGTCTKTVEVTRSGSLRVTLDIG
jgi:hypothetical protein